MASLEEQAGITKLASEDAKEDLEHEKEEDKKESDAKSELNKAEKDFSSLKKMNEKEESKDKKESKDENKSKEQTKEAQAAGAELANVLMQKVASAKTTKEKEMNKQASVAGKALADALLTKLANVGDVTATNGIPEGITPNKNQIDNASLVAEQDSYINPMPTKDAVGNGGGSINQIFDSIVADAIGQGGANFDQSEGQGVSAHEGAVEDSATPNQVPSESVEKTAAVISLVNSGVDFDSAVDLVKAAAFEIESEEYVQVKQAAFNELLDAGVDFDLAAALVKSANALTTIAGKAGRGVSSETMGQAAMRNLRNGSQWAGRRAAEARQAISGHAASVVADAKRVPAGMAALANPGRYATRLTRGQVAKDLAKNKAMQYGAGALAAGGTGGAYALGREKKAAVSALMEAGVDFDQAVGLVQAKSDELYGA
jgi:hypothetical protein